VGLVCEQGRCVLPHGTENTDNRGGRVASGVASCAAVGPGATSGPAGGLLLVILFAALAALAHTTTRRRAARQRN